MDCTCQLESISSPLQMIITLGLGYVYGKLLHIFVHLCTFDYFITYLLCRNDAFPALPLMDEPRLHPHTE